MNTIVTNNRYTHLLIVAALFSILCSLTVAARTNSNLNLNWKFNKSDVQNGQSPSLNDASWATVHIPHTFDYTPKHMSSMEFRGVCWYRKTFAVDQSADGKKIFLTFEGVMTTAQVYINGTRLTTHYGGYLPFTVDITDAITIGSATNLVALRVDNRVQRDVPPERPDNKDIDYMLFGGIYRNVTMRVTDNLFVPQAVSDATANGGGLFITTPEVSTGSARITIKTVVKNDNTAQKSTQLKTTIFDTNGNAVGTAQTTQNIASGNAYTFNQNITVNNPSLWTPTSPTLYTLLTEIYDNTTVVDTMLTRFGIRSIRFDRNNGFYLNGQRVKLLGNNRHQTFPHLGNALPDRAQVREAQLLKRMGCNFVRLSHYPQSNSFMNALDELGIMSWVEVPTWQGYELTTTWKNRHHQNIRDMIRRDRNHPGVIMWGVGTNEGERAASFEEPCEQTAKSEDDTRYTTAARNYQNNINTFDIYGHNHFRSPLPNSNPSTGTTGYLNAEHTGHTYQTARFNPERHLIEHSRRHEVMTSDARNRSWVAGGAGWCAFDYNSRFSGAGRMDIVDGDTLPDHGVAYHGVADLFRIPKFAFYFYQSQAAADGYDGSKNPMVFIESYADYSMPSTRTIKVLSSCDQVELFMNDESQGTRSPDGGTSLAHPPFTFSNIRFESPGTLRADGKINGNVVASHTVRRPGSAAKVMLSSDTDTLFPDGTDIALMVAKITDNNGTVIPRAKNRVTVSASGPGKVICGPDGPQSSGTMTVEAGQLGFLVQAGLSPGAITVSASASGLTAAQMTIHVYDTPTPVIHLHRPSTASAIMPPVPLIRYGKGAIIFDNLDKTACSKLMLFSMNGRIINTIMVSNNNRVIMTTEQFPNGFYIALLQSGPYTVQKKVLLVK